MTSYFRSLIPCCFLGSFPVLYLFVCNVLIHLWLAQKPLTAVLPNCHALKILLPNTAFWLPAPLAPSGFSSEAVLCLSDAGCSRNVSLRGSCGGQGEGAGAETGNELCQAVLWNQQVHSLFTTHLLPPVNQ